MRIISQKILHEFWEKHPDSQQPWQAWFADVKTAHWKSTADIKNIYRNVSFVANNRVIFNIKGNAYRIVIVVQYKYGMVNIHFIGTHQEYDRIDVTTI